MIVTQQKYATGESAVKIAASIEAAIREARLTFGDPLPTVRALARTLRVSPTTVAAAYRSLRWRGLIVTGGRRGTRVSHRPPVITAASPPLRAGIRNLADGSPDPALLPNLKSALAAVDTTPRLYTAEPHLPALLDFAALQFANDGIPSGALAVVSGALDGIERVLQAHLRVGDRVAVEDPVFSGVLDLLTALGLTPVPVELDGEGLRPDRLDRVLRAGVHALIATPRAQNPTGAALGKERTRDLQRILRKHPDLLLIEDDHAGPVAGVPLETLCRGHGSRWAVIRSVSKFLGPDLRLAVLIGDTVTISRVTGRQLLGVRWVSSILQQLVLTIWSAPSTIKLLKRAARVYAQRRDALVRSLAAHGIQGWGRSGLHVWVPVPEEARVTQSLYEAGWAVAPGERYRIASAPGIRITVAALPSEDAPILAAELARCLAPQPWTSPA